MTGRSTDVLMALSHRERRRRSWLSTDTAIYIGIVYSYLPFMVLPLYATLEKLDESLLEAAADLGCPRWKSVLAGHVAAVVVRAWSPACCCASSRSSASSSFPTCLGGSRSPMIGQTIWTEFFGNKDWPAASAVAVVLVCLLVTPIVDLSAPGDARGGAGLTMRKVSAFNLASLALGIGFLYLPIVILVIYSFNASRLVAVWGGWSTRWYGELINDAPLIEAALDQLAPRARLGERGDGVWARSRRWRWCGSAASAAGCCSRP